MAVVSKKYIVYLYIINFRFSLAYNPQQGFITKSKTFLFIEIK